MHESNVLYYLHSILFYFFNVIYEEVKIRKLPTRYTPKFPSLIIGGFQVVQPDLQSLSYKDKHKIKLILVSIFNNIDIKLFQIKYCHLP